MSLRRLREDRRWRLVGEPLVAPDRGDDGEVILLQLPVRVLVELHAVALTADLERVEVAVLPSHRRLEDAVELVEPKARRHEKAAPHARLDLAQLDRAVDDGFFASRARDTRPYAW